MTEKKAYAIVDTDTGQLLQVSTEPPDSVKPASRTLTHLAFLRKFTDMELAGVYAAEKQSPLVEVWMDKFRLAQEVNLDDPEIIGGLYALEQMGILAAGRAAEVLG